MTRELSEEVTTVLNGMVVIPVLLCRIDFATPITVNTGVMSLSFNGENYTAVGEFAGAESIADSSQLQQTSVNLSLSGVDLSLVNECLGENYQGKDCKIWIAFLSEEDYSIVDEPILLFRGKCNNSQITLGKEEATISLNVIARASSLYNEKIRRYNSADQNRTFPTDKGFQYVEQSSNKQPNWGSANAS